MKILLLALSLSSTLFAANYKANDLAFFYSLKLKKTSYLRLVDIVSAKYLKNLTPRLEMTKKSFYLTSVKFATCFKVLNSNICQHQIRLIFQSSFRGEPINPELSTLDLTDDTIHVFFDLSKVDFIKMVKRMEPLNRANSSSWVHRSLSYDRGALSFNKLLKQKLKNLYIITAMEGDGVALWNFFNIYPKFVKDSTVRGFKVFGKNVKEQKALVEANCFRLKPSGCNINMAMKKIAKLESPKLTHVASVDCASCHLVMPLKSLFKKTRYDYSNDIQSDRLRTKYLRILNSDFLQRFSLANLRQFGYFGRKVSVGKRAFSEILLEVNAFKKLVRR